MGTGDQKVNAEELDVPSNLQRELEKSGTRSNASPRSPTKTSTISYTHLDVYKRQALLNWLHILHLEGLSSFIHISIISKALS